MLPGPTRPRRPRIVLAGGGHAHLYTLRRTAALARDGFDVTLVNPSPYLPYSGMATGTISGDYRPDAHRIDVRALVKRGGSFVEGRVERIAERHLVLEGGEHLPFDAASATLGSTTPDGLASAPAIPTIFPTKPIERLDELRGALLALDEPRVVVVGGGPAGCEVSANALALLRRHGKGGKVTLVESGATLLPGAPPGARREISSFLSSWGAEIITNSAVSAAADGNLRTENGHVLPCDVVVLATGVVPPTHVFRASGLPVGEDGGLWVDASLRSLGNGRLFGGGDSISFRGTGLPRLGVFAIRQGPVIHHNLKAVLRDEPLAEYKPQKRYLYVLNLGDDTGLAIYGSLWRRGRLAHLLKHVIDKRFVERQAV